jgi:hypothetical protein
VTRATCLHIQLGVLALRHDLAGGRFAAERPTARGGHAKRPSARSVGLINIRVVLGNSRKPCGSCGKARTTP